MVPTELHALTRVSFPQPGVLDTPINWGLRIVQSQCWGGRFPLSFYEGPVAHETEAS